MHDKLEADLNNALFMADPHRLEGGDVWQAVQARDMAWARARACNRMMRLVKLYGRARELEAQALEAFCKLYGNGMAKRNAYRAACERTIRYHSAIMGLTVDLAGRAY